MSESTKAVFLSYASQDAAAALRLCTALRAAGVEVWLDQEGGLVGGDAWDRKIREQIATCTLFVALVSANTQARKEGYFRLEWHLAEERARLIAKGVPFIVPVSIDGTAERGALVPDVFLAVQWTRLPGGEAPAAFVARVGKLLGVATAEPTPTPAARGAPGPPAVASAHSEVAIQNPELPPAVRLPREDAFETFERQRPLWRRALPFVSGVIVTALVGGLAAWRLWPTPASAPMTQFVYPLPEGQTLRGSGRKVIAVSPDGRRFVFPAQGGGLHLRSLDELKAHRIPGAEGTLLNPFFSPDGQSVGYWQSGQLKRIAIKGGTPVVIGAFPDNPFDISWAPDGTILFGREGIFRVPATGGTPAVVIPAQKGHLLGNPQLLPDGDTVLFTEQKAEITSIDEARIVAQKISTGARKVLVESGAGARYLATGHLVYLVGNVLMGVAFDARRLAVTGGAVPVVQGVMRTTGSHYKGTANYGIAADGTLVWVFSATFADSNTWQVGLSDRAGKLTPLALRAGPYEAPRASPDGKRVALGVVAAKESYVAIYDLDGKTALRRLTFGGNSRFPVWSRDGQRVAFQSDREGDLAIFWQRADGTAPAERLTKPEKGTGHVPASWSPQDETLLFTVVASTTRGTVGELWTYTRASGTAEAYGNVKDVGPAPMFSPDGRWVVYSVRPNGVFIQPFPATGVQHQGPRGVEPIWSSDGTMLTYGTTLSRWAAVTVTMQPAPAFGNPTPLPKPFPPATTTMPRIYDIMPDDRMIGLITPGQAVGEAETEPPEIRVVLNWTEELKRLVPVK